MTQEEIFPQIVEATKAIQSDPGNIEALKLRAQLLHAAGMHTEALADLDRIIDTLHASDAASLQLRGSIRMQQGDKDGAFADLQALVKLQPELLQHLTGEYASKKSGHC